MPPVTWSDDGLPHSARYQDIYRSQGPSGDHGLQQARHVFLEGCRLLGPSALWRHQVHWCVLENGFGLGLNFLATWLAWRDDPDRPTRLHYVATEAHPVHAADLVRSSQPWPELQPLAHALAQDWWGLLPGMHRLSFEGGAVVLDLTIGDSKLCLPQLQLQADSVYLDGFSPRRNADMWDATVLAQLLRLSRPRAHWATWCVAGTVTHAMTKLGLQLIKRPGLPPKRESLRAICPPPPDTQRLATDVHPSTLSGQPIWVLGAGLAGAATAHALADRGHEVKVFDATGPAAGASGLPAGLCAAHTSGDDNDLSRLTRLGLRHTLAKLRYLSLGTDWAPSGLDEHLLGAKARRQPPDDAALCRGWMPEPLDQQAWRPDWWQPQPGGWHQPHAAWLRPTALVQHLLDHPKIVTVWGWSAQQLTATPQGWCMTNAQGRELNGAAAVVLALGPASQRLLPTTGQHLPLQAVRGQLSWGALPMPIPASWPARPCNGDGSVLPRVPLGDTDHWLVGSSFDRASDQPMVLDSDHGLNAQRWARLSPSSAPYLPPRAHWQAWAGVRATVRDRLPWVGPVPGSSGLWLLAGLGARGLTLSVLCGEHLAARMSGAPDPIPAFLAAALDTARAHAPQ
jgi:tRNA 5-methylaminomethyl-2-thiouridine biosynthesis bifunctional protein